MMNNCSIAVITEDKTDFEVVRKIVHRVLDSNIKTKNWSSKGCGRLKRKLEANLLGSTELAMLISG
jgi:hypothetical protein